MKWIPWLKRKRCRICGEPGTVKFTLRNGMGKSWRFWSCGDREHIEELAMEAGQWIK